VKRALVLPLKLAVSAGLIYVILRGVALEAVWRALGRADPWLLALAFAMFFLGYGITAWRWRILLAAQGVQAPLGYLVRSFMVAIFFNNFLPSTIGGDAVRVYDSWRAGGGKARAVAVVFTDRLFGMSALLLLAALALWWAPPAVAGLAGLRGFLALALLGVGGLLVAFFRGLGLPWLERWRRHPGPAGRVLDRLAEAVAAFRGRRDVVAKALGLSLLLQANVILHYLLIGWALHLPVPWPAYFLIVPIAILTMMLPVSINGIGVREGVFVFLLGLYGVARPEALALAWIAFGFVLAQGVLGGVVYALRR